MLAIAKEHSKTLRGVFVTVVALTLAVYAIDYVSPLEDRKTWEWPMLLASLPWSAPGLVMPFPLFVIAMVAVGLGINTVAVAIIVLWWLKTLRANNDA